MARKVTLKTRLMERQPTVREDVSVAKDDDDNCYEFIDGDELTELKLLRMMSSPAYIFACYKYVVETSTSGELSENKYGYTCECNKAPSTLLQ